MVIYPYTYLKKTKTCPTPVLAKHSGSFHRRQSRYDVMCFTVIRSSRVHVTLGLHRTTEMGIIAALLQKLRRRVKVDRLRELGRQYPVFCFLLLVLLLSTLLLNRLVARAPLPESHLGPLHPWMGRQTEYLNDHDIQTVLD